MRIFIIAILVATWPLASETASAQSVGNFNSVNFRPIGGRYRTFAVEESPVADAWAPYGHILFHGERDSLKLRNGNHEELLVSQHHFVDLNLGVGLFGFLQLDVGMPIALVMESDPDTGAIAPVSGGGLGDLIIRIKGTPLNNSEGGFGIAVSAGVTVPTGDGDHFRGDPGVGVLATVIPDYRWDIATLALNLGVRIRTEEAVFKNITFGNELLYGFGLQISPWKHVIDIGVELFGSTKLSEPFQDSDATSLELMFGPKWWIIDELSVQLGIGAGLLQGHGTPDFRFVTGVVWAPARRS